MFINIMYVCIYIIILLHIKNNILKYKKIFNNDIIKNHCCDITIY